MAPVEGLNSLHPLTPSQPAGHVVGAIDDNMAYPLLVWAWSLIRTAKRPLFFTVGFLSGTLSDQKRCHLEEFLNHWGIDHEFRELAHDPRFVAQGHISPTTFAKFLLADGISSAHVWIDADAVGQHGWDQIFDAVDEVTEAKLLLVAGRNHGEIDVEKSNQLAFNAGVLGWPARKRRPWSRRLDHMDLVETQEQQLFNELYGDALEVVSADFNTLSYQVDSLGSSPHEPRIIHFAGPQKPWHLPARFRGRCRQYHCPWSAWFEEEEMMLGALESSSLRAVVLGMRRESRSIGPLPVGRHNRGRLLLWLLSRLGPAGWIVIAFGAMARPIIPTGTHPLH